MTESWTDYVRRNNIGYSGTWFAFNSILAMMWFSGVLMGGAIVWALLTPH